MQDLCALLGAKLVSKESGHKFSEIDLTWLGKVERIVSSAVSTTFTGGAGTRKDVLQRIQIIKKHLEDKTITEFEKANLQERLGKLTNGIAVVKVGGETEVEMNERKERAIDAVAATQAAVKYGIVPGGETVYLTAREVLDQSNLGEKILYDALSEPFKKLISNAGYDSGEKLAELKSEKILFGFDVTDGNFKDMIKSGIIDPLLVPETAVKTAVSVAVQIMTIGCAIVPEENYKKVS
jgi:chaperonin GroEL